MVVAVEELLTIEADHIVHVPGRVVSVRARVDHDSLSPDSSQATQSTQA